MTFDDDSYEEDPILARQAKRLSTRIDAVVLQYIEDQKSESAEHIPYVILSAIASALIKLVAITGDRDFLFDTLQDMVPENEILQKLDVADLSMPISIKRH